MTNADKFKSLFGIYATELWAMPEKNFLKWLNSEVSNSSESPNGWIPCSERLPEEDECVLVTDDYDCIRHCIFCKRGETWRGFVTYEEGMTIDAIAWQPLPSPYREEADE